MSPPRVLTIAGSDPSGGAGLQADLKTFEALGVYGMSVVTALTAQNTVGVRGVHAPPAEFVAAQLEALLDDCPPVATKTGMLFSREVIHTVAEFARRGALGHLVVDPVMVATSGDRLLRADAEAALRDELLPLATVVTPNLPEAAALLDAPDAAALRAGDQESDAIGAVAKRVAARFDVPAVVKGGHGAGESVCDALCRPTVGVLSWERPRLPVGEAHGTGCTLSAALAAMLAQGQSLVDAVQAAGDFVHAGLRASYPVGAGAVPVNHRAAGRERDR